MSSLVRTAKSLLKASLQWVRKDRATPPAWHSPQRTENLKILSSPGRHLFFGYYDLAQLDESGRWLLAHQVPRNARTSRNAADLLLIDFASDKRITFASTRAWCWQQGARLRWHPTAPDLAVFNALGPDGFHASVVDPVGSRTVATIPWPLYDIDSSFRHGASCNFSRLQRLRPGYGYDTLPDTTASQRAPADDGLFLVDLATGERELACSLAELAEEVDPALDGEHYINHISFAPDGSKLMFFHAWTCDRFFGWMTRLCVFDLERRSRSDFNDGSLVSHYAWKDPNTILATGFTVQGDGFYREYAIEDTIVSDSFPELRRDGHPSFLGGSSILSDTYPDFRSRQQLFEYDTASNELTLLANVHSDPFQYGERRCDLHPRWHPRHSLITFDSTQSGKTREIISLTLSRKRER